MTHTEEKKYDGEEEKEMSTGTEIFESIPGNFTEIMILGKDLK